MKKNESSNFHDEILSAIWGYLSDKLNITLAELSRDTALGNEKMIELGNDIKKELSDVIDTCEIARYAPSSINVSMEELYNKSVKLIIKLEQKIR